MLLVTIGGGVFGRQIMWNDLIVTCYLLLLGEHKYADTFRESVFLRHVPPIPSQPGAKRAPLQTYREPWALAPRLIFVNILHK